MRQIFLDTETTGLNAESGDRIIEIGCVEMLNRRLSGRNLHFYLNPERSSHEDAVKVHGLTDEFLADKPKFAEIVADFVEFIRGAELVIHNAAFDVGFLNNELGLLQQESIDQLCGEVIDTLRMAREMRPGKKNNLNALCAEFGVDNSGRQVHGALLDAGLLAEVYIRMTRGQDSLVIDEVEASTAEVALESVDLSAFTLPVIAADAAEVQAHAALIAELDQASGGKTVWKAAEPAVA
ncbi:DNA polymerase III subunit epsilon [Piscinibacter sp.]|uniref:DNA polymerase III subunit epsilon n=1 Tax=Piscinibacter sp. TaxID=1903157 RepID=UPI0037850F42